jgi:hypothetical protein
VSSLRLLSPPGAALAKLPKKTKADAKAVAAQARIAIPSLFMISPLRIFFADWRLLIAAGSPKRQALAALVTTLLEFRSA